MIKIVRRGCTAKRCPTAIGGVPSRMVLAGSVMGLVSGVRAGMFVSGESVLYHRRNREGAGNVTIHLDV